MSESKPHLIIIGAGPIGLETALYARVLGYNVTVLEKNRVANHVRQWGHVRMFSPFSMNHTRLGKQLLTENNVQLPEDGAYLTGNSFFSSYLDPLAMLLGDAIFTQCEVKSISRRGVLKNEHIGTGARGEYPFRILAQTHNYDTGDITESILSGDVIIDASGTYGQPNALGNGGIPAPGETACRTGIAYHLENLANGAHQKYQGKTTLLLGDGLSAATTATAFETLFNDDSSTRLIWLTRHSGVLAIREIPNDPLPGRLQVIQKANRIIQNDRVTWMKGASVEALSGDNASGYRVSVNTFDGPLEIEVDRIIANVGYRPDNRIYQELQIHECYASQAPMKLAAALLAAPSSADCLDETSNGPDVLINPEPNFYIIGMKSYGRNSNFLLRIGHDQIRDTFQLITGNTQLDLYATDNNARQKQSGKSRQGV